MSGGALACACAAAVRCRSGHALTAATIHATCRCPFTPPACARAPAIDIRDGPDATAGNYAPRRDRIRCFPQVDPVLVATRTAAGWHIVEAVPSKLEVGHGHHEPRRPRRPLERVALEDRRLRLDRLRRARVVVGGAVGGRRRWSSGRSRTASRGAPSRFSTRATSTFRRARACSSSRRRRRSSTRRSRRRSRTSSRRFPAVERHEHRLPARAARRRPRLRGPPLRARPVRRQGRRGGRQGQDRADPGGDRRGPGRHPEPDHRGVRAGLRRPRAVVSASSTT